MENKPQSTSLKDWLIALTAKSLDIPESTCDTVINWAYVKAKEATLTAHSSIEFSGFGKIYASTAKIRRKREKATRKLESLLADPTESFNEQALKAHGDKINKLREYIAYLDSKNR